MTLTKRQETAVRKKLMNAMEEGSVTAEQVRKALEDGLPPGSCDKHGWSLLHQAAYSEAMEAVHVLIEAGADPNAALLQNFYPSDEPIKKGTTPLGIAREWENEELIAGLSGKG